MAERTVTVGLAQRAPLPLGRGIEELRADVRRTIREHPGIDLLAYPELHLCDTEHLPEAERNAALEDAAVTLDSDEVSDLGRIAAENGVWFCPGSIGERGPDGGFYNTQLLFDPAGRLRSSYRKMFPWRPFEPHDPGTEFAVHELDGAGTVGLSICYDAWFPEHSRQLAWLGAGLILNIVRTTTPDREQELVLARANAIVNQCMVASVNCVGPSGRGRSIIVDAEGFVVCEAGVGEQTLVADFDPAAIARVRERGTMGSNRMWEQFRAGDPEIPLPLYGGRIAPDAWRPGDRPT
ncbi:carbon-nitrogen hydrolase family protein [Leucobacter weissii]|uniref:Carbon-nitrogen hydrolase family protein n=1 Tax=Leucobacter weissii TaxID=1983706 RepID=A0A939MJX0_9MICO|nr:carbon-nitrogen hydrolase family protein [Leucobacter weissii]MBO1901595.1 carbon-nitrogen hydrolase family protein [Leucobacter weissii]